MFHQRSSVFGFLLVCSLSVATAAAQGLPAPNPAPLPPPAPVHRPTAKPAAASRPAAQAAPAPQSAPAPALEPVRAPALQPAAAPTVGPTPAPAAPAASAQAAPAPVVQVLPPSGYVPAPTQAAPPPQPHHPASAFGPPPAPGMAAPYGYYPPPTRSRPRLSRGMMITGIAMFAASYGLSAMVGLVLLDECDSDSDCMTVGGELLVPVLGPFLAAGTVDEASALLVAWGLVQAVGAGLMIGGIVRYKNSKRQAEEEGYLVLKLPRDKTLAFDAAASPQLVGPRMRLRF